MKILKKIIIGALSLMLLAGCSENEAPSEYKFRAVVNEIGEGELLVTVSDEDGLHFGEYRVLVSTRTVYYLSDGVKGNIGSVEHGDVIEVTYNGQVMRSFPPQVAALKIAILAKSK